MLETTQHEGDITPVLSKYLDEGAAVICVILTPNDEFLILTNLTLPTASEGAQNLLLKGIDVVKSYEEEITTSPRH